MFGVRRSGQDCQTTMSFRAVLFDLDGTLLDTLEDLADTTNAVLRRNGLPEHPLEPYRYFVGDGAENLLRRALPAAGPGSELLVICQDRYRFAVGLLAAWQAGHCVALPDFDPANLVLYGKANPIDAVEIIGEYVKGMHAKDGVWPNRDEYLGHETPLGQGMVRFNIIIPRPNLLLTSRQLTIYE